jgi:hypothetical protein
MATSSQTLQSLKYSRDTNSLEVLDQLEVPHRITYIAVKNSEDAWSVIRKMQVFQLSTIFIEQLVHHMKDIKIIQKHFRLEGLH